MVTRLQHESRTETILRLAERAHESGVQILQDSRGRYWASSVSHPGHTHAVTALSCDCKGFTHRGHCIHRSLLLVTLGWVADEPEPATCQWCTGQGSTPGTELFNGRRVDILVTCWHCRGTGHQQTAA